MYKKEYRNSLRLKYKNKVYKKWRRPKLSLIAIFRNFLISKHIPQPIVQFICF